MLPSLKPGGTPSETSLKRSVQPQNDPPVSTHDRRFLMNKRLIPIALLVTVLLGGLAFTSSTQFAYAMPYATSYTVTASSVSFVSGMPNSDSNWARANVTCSGSSNFKLSTTLPTWPFNPANWSAQWCRNNVVQIGIPSSFYLWVWPNTGPYQNRANWRVTYTR